MNIRNDEGGRRRHDDEWREVSCGIAFIRVCVHKRRVH